MEGDWAYNERGNMRRKALRKVDQLVESLQNVQEAGNVNMEASLDAEVSSGEDEEDMEFCEMSEADTSSRFEDSNEEDDHHVRTPDLHSSLVDWAIEFGISLIALSALLSILRFHHPCLPKDGRTLLKTKTTYNIQHIAGGTFHYFGILNAFQRILDEVYQCLPDGHAFKLQLNFDGLPLFKSSSTQFWPILGILQGHCKKPAVIGIFCGNAKPSSLAEYLQDLVAELTALGCGFIFKGKSFVLNICSVLCDAPARAFIRAVKSHTAYHGCERCVQTGLRIGSRMTYPEVNARLRTDQCFRDCRDEDHHHGDSPLCQLDIDMVTTFPHDYMHLVCLGVMRRLLDLWLGPPGPLCCRLSANQACLVSDTLLSLKDHVPSEFARRPRALLERKRWKATELRQFLLYTGPVVLKDVLRSQIYDNFMLLSVGVYILASPKYCASMNDRAETLLRSFVQHFGCLYGPEFLVYNVHGLVHLSQDVKAHGPLDVISGFPFENFLGYLKKNVRSPCNPLTQVVRRLSEVENAHQDISSQNEEGFRVEHSDGPVPHSNGGIEQYKTLSKDGFIVKPSKRDSCIRIRDEVVVVENFFIDGGIKYVAGREFQCKEAFFLYPFDSREVGIFKVSHLATTLKYFVMDEHVQKYVRLPYHNHFVIVPLLHGN